MIPVEIRATLLAALQQHKGDDLERARAWFRRCTPEQMAEQWGESGLTRQQVVDQYQANRDRIARAEAWVESQAADGGYGPCEYCATGGVHGVRAVTVVDGNPLCAECAKKARRSRR